jgi:predicted transport protein
MTMSPDLYEQMAIDLEAAQQKRFRSYKDKKNFFDVHVEKSIFEMILLYREKSKTYQPSGIR